MSWDVIPVRLPSVEVHIHADRRLAFEVVSAFGAQQAEGGASRVLRDEGPRKLVEFRSTVPSLAGKTRQYRTVEWVTLDPPRGITFEGVEGPLPYLRDRFVFEDVGGCTLFRYESTAGLKGWVLGWLVVQTYVRWSLGRFMRRHGQGVKERIEARARRSRVYPYRECGVGGAGEGSP